MNVRVLSGGIAIKMFCRALEEGRQDQLINVRNVKSRESFVVRVVGPAQGLLVIGQSEGTGRSEKAVFVSWSWPRTRRCHRSTLP